MFDMLNTRSAKRVAIRALPVALATCLLSVSGVPALAQATPPTGEIVPASECTVEPRPVTFLSDLVQTPVPAATPVPITGVPEGTAPDQKTVDEITKAVREIVACANTGDILRGLALFSDEYLRRTLDPTGQLKPDTALEIIQSIATPTPMSEDTMQRLIAIRQIVQLPDGTVAAVVESDTTLNRTPGDTDIDLFVFAKVGDRWIVVDAKRNIDEQQ